MSGRISKYVNANSMTRQQLVWKCGIYLRLSREDGDKMESDSIANQRKIIDRFLEKNSDIEIYDIYTDDGYTGSNFDRPAIIRLMDDIKARKSTALSSRIFLVSAVIIMRPDVIWKLYSRC